MQFAFCTTTIHVPTVLEAYAQDFVKHGHRDVRFYVVADLKTPPSAEAFCNEVGRKYGLEMEYMTVEAQKAFMAAYPELDAHLPYNSVQRRNIGHLKAIEDGCSTLIAVDDDNFPDEPDYLRQHRMIGETRTLEAASGADGWYNVCLTLEDRNGRFFFPRGYAVTKRVENGGASLTPTAARIAVNAGLWMGDPDVDAATRLAAPIDVVRYRRSDSLVLAKGTFCPFNSQNTAIGCFALPAYFLSPHVGRYDDIWASYVFKVIADHLGWSVAYGSPVVRQDRNAHDLFHDLSLEQMGMRKTEAFIELLTSVPISGDDFQSASESLISQAQARNTLPECEAYFAGYALWLASTRRALSRRGK